VPQVVLRGKLPDHFDYWQQEYVHLAGAFTYGYARRLRLSWPAGSTLKVQGSRFRQATSNGGGVLAAEAQPAQQAV
jgi:hypothetical protein